MEHAAARWLLNGRTQKGSLLIGLDLGITECDPQPDSIVRAFVYKNFLTHAPRLTQVT